MGLSSPSKKLESPSSLRDKYVDTRSLAEKGVNLTALLIAFPILAFSYPLSLLTRGTLHGVWNFSKEIRPPITQIWADFMTSNVMNVRFKIVSQKQLYRDGKCVYLCNHRAWATCDASRPPRAAREPFWRGGAGGGAGACIPGSRCGVRRNAAMARAHLGRPPPQVLLRTSLTPLPPPPPQRARGQPTATQQRRTTTPQRATLSASSCSTASTSPGAAGSWICGSWCPRSAWC